MTIVTTKNIYALRGPVPVGTLVWHWTVLGEAPSRHGLRFLRCRCVCGVERDVFIRNLRIGLSKSCCCQSKARTHRLSSSKEYRVYQSMIQRCHNPKDKAFKNYGARGIHVCERWRNSFSDFIADVGRRPSPELTLDRSNNNGNYEPGNVRWATRVEQAANTRVTHEQRVERGRRQARARWDRRKAS